MDKGSSLICSIIIGETTINLKCPTPDYAKGIREYFASGKIVNSDIEIELKITAEDEAIQIPESLFTTKSVQNNSFSIKGNCAKGHFDPDLGKGLIQAHHLLTSSTRTRLFEQLLYQAFYSASKKMHYNAILIHSCGIIKEDSGYLFVGKSGSGKSTIAELSKNYCVLNDEITMIELDKEKPVIHSTPFNGYFKAKTKGSSALKAIFFLEHAESHRVSIEKVSIAVKNLFQEIVPVIGLEEEINHETHTTMLNYATIITQKIPVYKLEFSPDPGFWEEICKKVTEDGEK